MNIPESLEVRIAQAAERKRFLRIARDEALAEVHGLKVGQFEEYLGSLGTTLWSDWDVTDPKRRKLAAEWFVGVTEDFERWFAEGCQCDECVPK